MCVRIYFRRVLDIFLRLLLNLIKADDPLVLLGEAKGASAKVARRKTHCENNGCSGKAWWEIPEWEQSTLFRKSPRSRKNALNKSNAWVHEEIYGKYTEKNFIDTPLPLAMHNIRFDAGVPRRSCLASLSRDASNFATGENSTEFHNTPRENFNAAAALAVKNQVRSTLYYN